MIKDNVEFFVNEAKRTVVCKYVGGHFTALMEDIAEELHFPFTSKDYFAIAYVEHHPHFWLQKNSLVAKAVCCPEDEFYVNIGKDIAYNKLRQRLIKHVLKEIQYSAGRLQSIQCELELQGMMARDRWKVFKVAKPSKYYSGGNKNADTTSRK